ncbi:MAG: xanthine dehydrogenase family protein molybdopterin-binding subunit [Anaerolineales bacterium]|nr:xanthine dehydrogenase family protein molybdopterin-binding subunit [Anaerolineales bacterium]
MYLHIDIVGITGETTVGTAINPLQVDAQMEDALIQASGYAPMENLVEEDGYVKTPNLSTCLIPTVLDIPKKMKNIILEVPDRRGPWGVRGMGEIPFLALAPVIAAGIHAAAGVWIDQFPLTPEVVLQALEEAKA